MSKTVVTPQSYFKTLNILFFALLAGQIMFAAAAILINYTQPIAPVFTQDLQQLLLIIMMLIALVNIGVSYVIFTGKIKAIRNQADWESRLRNYQTALIIRFALMEMPSILATLLFMLSGNMLFLGFTGAIILVFLFLKPSSKTMVNHLKLDYNDEATLQDSHAVLYEKEWAID